MKNISLLIALFLFACEGTIGLSDDGFSSDGAPNNGDQSEESGDDLDGEALFAMHCATCHGSDAKGNAIWPGSIEGYEPIEELVIEGRGTMAPIPISVEETQKIQNFLLTLGTPTQELDGKGLYDRYCSSCHGADALGTNIWEGSIQGYEPIKGIVDRGRGTMAAVPLSSTQVSDIQDYLLTLAPPLSTLNGPEVYQRLCVGCHGNKGAGDTKGMQLRYDDLEFSRYWIRNGRGKTLNYSSDMPAYPSDMISNQQIDEMFAEIDSVPHPTDGKGLFEQYCTNCHGFDGRGGPAHEGIRGTGEYNEKIREGEGGRNYGRRRSYMTRWNSNQISSSEISKMKSYVRNNL